MYIIPIVFKLISAGMIILAVILSHQDADEQTQAFLNKTANVLYILAFVLLIAFGL